jgi:cytochrome P450
MLESVSSTSLLGIAALSLVFLKLSSSNDQNGKHSKKAPPMAPTGLFETMKSLSGTDSPWFFLETARELKSCVFRLKLAAIFGCPMFAVVGDHKLAQKVFTDPLTTKPEEFYSSMEGMTGGIPNLFTTNGAYWHSRRKGVAPAFSSKHIKRMNEVASDKANEWIETKLDAFVDDDKAFDVGKEMIDITLSTISAAGFEFDISDEEKKMFVLELELVCKEFFFKTSTNPLRKYFGLLIPERRRAYVASDRIHSLSLKIIYNYRKLQNPTKGTIIDLIMTNDVYKNDAERASDITVYFIGGHDTTAYTVAWILKELAKNKEEQQKLRDSLALMKKEDWGQSEALGKIVKEGMRLHPVAAMGSSRKIGIDIESDDGFVLPKGSLVSIPVILATRNSNIYENADTFIPSRWDYATNEMNEAFYPFAIGKRNCVGQSLAKAEIRTLIPQICSKFELELESEGHTEFFLTLKPIKTMIKAKKV